MRTSAIAKRQQSRTERARKGGTATMARYGREHYVRIGKLGGRPTFHEAVAKARAREAEVQSKRTMPGRPRKAPPAGETKEAPPAGETKKAPADAAACREPVPAEPGPANPPRTDRLTGVCKHEIMATNQPRRAWITA